MTPVPHRIRRLRWKVRAGSGADAFAIRKLLRARWENLFLPAFGEVCDRSVDGDVVVRIPRIELHLKVSSLAELDGMAPDRVDMLLRDQIGLALERARAASQEKPPEKRRRGAAEPDDEDPGSQGSLEEHLFERLIRYLRTGSLDWDAPSDSSGAVAAELKNEILRQLPRLRESAGRTRESPAFFFRLIQLLGEGEAAVLAEGAMAEPLQPWNAPGGHVVSQLLKSEGSMLGRLARIRLAALFWSEILARREQAAAPNLFAVATASIPDIDWHAVAEFFASLTGAARAIFGQGARRPGIGGTPAGGRGPDDAGKKGRNSPGRAPSSGPGGLHSEDPDRSDDGEGTGEARDGALREPGADLRGRRGGPGSDETGEPVRGRKPGASFESEPPESDEAVKKFGLVVNLAGLVLLHPFVTRLFENTGIKDRARPLLAETVLGRAATLLHWIGTGREEIHEFETPFIKVLLGLSPETELLVSCDCLLPGDREEGDLVLKSAVANWPAIRGTSIHGLRATFLDRPGYLRGSGDGWHLEFERRGVDVLLDSLPWTIGMVKMPWSSKFIYTKW